MAAKKTAKKGPAKKTKTTKKAAGKTAKKPRRSRLAKSQLGRPPRSRKKGCC